MGQQHGASVLPPTLLNHYILLFLKWSNRLKISIFLSHLEHYRMSLLVTVCTITVKKVQGLLLHFSKDNAMPPFQTMTCFQDRDQQQSTSTSYQDSREINLRKVVWLGHEIWDLGF